MKVMQLMGRMKPAPLVRLTRQDAGYLRREDATHPMHFALLLHLAPDAEGRSATLSDVRRHVAGRLPHLPELRRKIKLPPFGIGPSVWVEAGSAATGFPLERHVVAWEITPQHDEDVDRALAVEAARHLERGRPLWRMLVAPPLPDGRTPVCLAIHHAIMDGGLLRQVLHALGGDVSDIDPSTADDAPTPSSARLLVEGVATKVRDRLRRGQGAPPGPEAAPPAEERAGSLTGPLSLRRAFARVTLSLTELRELRRRSGATINDLLMAGVNEGLARYLAARPGGPLPDELVILVPRDVRSAEESRVTGNRTWSIIVSLPVAAASAPERLATVREVMDVAKAATRSGGTAGFRYDISITNVAIGADHAIAGHAVTEYHVMAPLQGENRLIVAGFSFEDTFTLSFTADAEAFGDVAVLAERVREGFEALQTPEGLRRPRTPLDDV